MATCPNCGTSSRRDPDAFTVTDALLAKPLGTWSLAGAQIKTSAVAVLKLTCRCGWSICGKVSGDSFLGDPATQHFPEDLPMKEEK